MPRTNKRRPLTDPGEIFAAIPDDLRSVRISDWTDCGTDDLAMRRFSAYANRRDALVSWATSLGIDPAVFGLDGALHVKITELQED
jgi:hypothetical protein